MLESYCGLMGGLLESLEVERSGRVTMIKELGSMNLTILFVVLKTCP